jgi:L-arabinose isomerase
MTMTREEFVSVLKMVARDSAVDTVLRNLETPPGRRPAPELVKSSAWFKQLGPEDREMVRWVVAKAAHDCLFGVFCVLDGVRAFARDSEANLELYYVSGGKRVLLNDFKEQLLHDILNAVDE